MTIIENSLPVTGRGLGDRQDLQRPFKENICGLERGPLSQERVTQGQTKTKRARANAPRVRQGRPIAKRSRV